MTPTTPAHQRTKTERWCPCEWVASLDEAAVFIDGKRRLCYVFIHLLGPELQGNFYRDPDMQKLSREHLVFVDMVVARTPAPEQCVLLRRCRVTAAPCAVITDVHGNPLCFNASTTDARALAVQTLAAQRAHAKRAERLAAARDEARKLCREERWLGAARVLADVRRENLTGLPILEEIEELFLELDARAAGRLEGILASEKNATRRKAQLRALLSRTHEDLPVRARIAAALKER